MVDATIPREWIDLSIIIYQVQCTFPTIPTCVHRPSRVQYPLLFTFTFRVVLQGYLMFVEHFTLVLMLPLKQIAASHLLLYHSSELCRDVCRMKN